MRMAMAVLFALTALSPAAADPDGILPLEGRGAEGHPRYKGGKVEFLDVSLSDQLVHFDGSQRIPLRLSIRYKVLETAPVLLNSRMGTEYWRLYDYGRDSVSALYTQERIDLSRLGEAVTRVEEATTTDRYGPAPGKGLVGIRGHYYFLVDQQDGQWLDVVDPPPFFDRPELARKLVFTLANLSRFTLAFSQVESTWERGGPIRVKLTVTDADGDTLPVVNAAATIESGEWRTALVTETDAVHVPTGWQAGRLPEDRVPERVVARATVSAMTPDGPKTLEMTGAFGVGEGKRPAREMELGPEPAVLPRNAEGVVRETRALWVGTRELMTKESIEAVVARAHEAGLNVLVPNIFVRSTFPAKSDLFPMSGGVEEGLDPVAYLIAQAHARGIEVHPWFCVTYRDAGFRAGFPGVDMVDRDGRVISLGADVHRREYRDFVVNLMVGVARDYAVDGIHLDYIRTMGQCYCDKCRTEFKQQFGKELTEASEEDWVAWQKQAIADIVARTADGVRKVRPKATMSAAVFSSMVGGGAQGQDAAQWARRGWLDVVIPMDYQMQSLVVRANERQFLEALDDDEQLVTGLSLYQRTGGEAAPRLAELVGEQIQLVRGMGIHGYCLFVYNYINDEILELLKTKSNADPAVPYFR